MEINELQKLNNILNMKTKTQIDLITRIKTPPAKFFVKIRNAAIAVGIISGAILTLPVSLPAGLIAIAGYGVAVGTIAGSIAHLTVDDKK
jgi:hypothetical protein